MEDFGAYPDAIVDDQQLLNVESPLGPPRESFATPAELFYIRSHGTIPEVYLQGYALVGGGRDVERVDLYPDEGQTWVGAIHSKGGNNPWAWSFWEATLVLEPGPHQVIVRAIHSPADTQPQDARRVWNVKGYAINSWHRVRVAAW